MEATSSVFLIDKGTLLFAGTAVALALAVVALLIRWLGRRRTARADDSPTLRIDVASLTPQPPAKDGPRLEFYGTQVQLAVIVVAPVGRDRPRPSMDELPAIIESLQPNMMRVVNAHQPMVRCWPAQLSSQGFTQAFFNNVVLPGNGGKGTAWCSVAGKIAKDNEFYLVGLACRGAKANSLGQVTIQHEGQWLDVLRVHRD